MTEIWKDIEGYEGLYQVSNLGKVRSNKKNIIISSFNRRGYKTVGLYNNGIRNNNSIHRLVAKAFIPNPENKRTVNHINGIKEDNRVENLEWATDSENIKHGYNNGLYYTKIRSIIQYSTSLEFINNWGCALYVERELGISQSLICKCCKGKRKTAGGFIWMYK